MLLDFFAERTRVVLKTVGDVLLDKGNSNMVIVILLIYRIKATGIFGLVIA